MFHEFRSFVDNAYEFRHREKEHQIDIKNICNALTILNGRLFKIENLSWNICYGFAKSIEVFENRISRKWKDVSGEKYDRNQKKFTLF